MSLVKEFKEFAMRGNVIDMAVGIVIGAAFGKIVSSFVADVVMPPIGLLTGGVDFSDKSIVLKNAVEAAPATETTAAVAASPAVVLNYGTFINTVVDFLIVAFAIFVVIKLMNAAKRK
ncbi:MAG: large-conductance mechanosensitive channel protein MscL [Phycisphaerales bacterium]